MKKKFNISIFTILIISLIIFLVLIAVFLLFQDKKERQKQNIFPFDIESIKFKGVYPDVIMLDGKININSAKNQKIEILYDKIYQYTSLNYVEIINPIITISQDNSDIYHITSKIAFADNLDNIKKFNLKGNALIKSLVQKIEISSELLICDLEKETISNDISSKILKDGFIIYSEGVFINNEYAIFKKNVRIENKTGLFDEKIVDEFRNFEGNCDNAIFYIKDKKILMRQNASVKSAMLDIKGNQINFIQIENSKNITNNNINRIIVIKGYAKYISIKNEIFYSKGDLIDYSQGNDKLYILNNGNGYYDSLIDKTHIFFDGQKVVYSQDIKDKSTFKINKGFLHQKKYDSNDNQRVISQFYSKGDNIVLEKEEKSSYKCVNGFGYLQDLEENNELVFSGKNINYIEKGTSKINQDANIYDFIGKIYIKGEELIYYEDKKIVVSEKPFFLRQFIKEYYYSNENIFKGIKPDFTKDFLNIKNEDFSLLINDISALKGKMNVENSSSILEGKVKIIDYQNLINIKSNYATYSGNEDQIYNAEGNLFIYQYSSIENILNNKYLSNIIQSDKAIVYKKENLAYFEGEPKIKNFTDNFFIKSDLLEAHLDTKVYVFKDNIKLLINYSENKEMESQIYIIGQYAVYDSDKKIITFSGPSILVQKNIEMYVNEIFVDFNQKTINFKGVKDSKLKKLKF